MHRHLRVICIHMGTLLFVVQCAVWVLWVTRWLQVFENLRALRSSFGWIKLERLVWFV